MPNIDLRIVNEHNGVEFKKHHIDLIKKSAALFERAINNKLFIEEVINFSYKPLLGKRRNEFRQNNGLTRKQIYNLFICGNDKFINQSPDDQNEQNDKDIDVWIHPFSEKSSTIDFTNKSTYGTWININKLDNWLEIHHPDNTKYVYSLLAGNIAHEYCHNLGFGHKNLMSSSQMRATVPYAIGIIVKTISSIINKEDEELLENFEAINLEVENKYACQEQLLSDKNVNTA